MKCSVTRSLIVGVLFTKQCCLFPFRAEQLCLTQNPDKENIPGDGKRAQGGSFFKKKTARRAKSLGKDHWDDVIFGMSECVCVCVQVCMCVYVFVCACVCECV